MKLLLIITLSTLQVVGMVRKHYRNTRNTDRSNVIEFEEARARILAKRELSQGGTA